MIVVVFITLFFLTVAPCYYFKRHLREFIFYLKLRGAIKVSNQTIKRLAIGAVILCNTILCTFSIFIVLNGCVGIYWFYTSLPRSIPPEAYTIEKGKYLYLEQKACSRRCNLRQDTLEGWL